jgi:hypothetical protein
MLCFLACRTVSNGTVANQQPVLWRAEELVRGTAQRTSAAWPAVVCLACVTTRECQRSSKNRSFSHTTFAAVRFLRCSFSEHNEIFTQSRAIIPLSKVVLAI